jgi:hypothetical protein
MVLSSSCFSSFLIISWAFFTFQSLFEPAINKTGMDMSVHIICVTGSPPPNPLLPLLLEPIVRFFGCLTYFFCQTLGERAVRGCCTEKSIWRVVYRWIFVNGMRFTVFLLPFFLKKKNLSWGLEFFKLMYQLIMISIWPSYPFINM